MNKDLVKKISKLRTMVAVDKNGKNKFGGFTYFQLPDIYAAVKTPMEELGLVSSMSNDIVETADETLYKSVLSISDGDNSIDYTFIQKYASDMKGMVNPMKSGSMLTYASKYLWFQVLLLDEAANDPDANDPKPTKATGTSGSALSRSEKIEKLKEHYTTEELKDAGVNNPRFVTAAKLDELLKDKGVM